MIARPNLPATKAWPMSGWSTRFTSRRRPGARCASNPFQKGDAPTGRWRSSARQSNNSNWSAPALRIRDNPLLNCRAYQHCPIHIQINKKGTMRFILLIILLLLIIGALPAWPYSTGWGYYPSGGLGLLLLIVLLIVLLR